MSFFILQYSTCEILNVNFTNNRHSCTMLQSVYSITPCVQYTEKIISYIWNIDSKYDQPQTKLKFVCVWNGMEWNFIHNSINFIKVIEANYVVRNIWHMNKSHQTLGWTEKHTYNYIVNTKKTNTYSHYTCMYIE